jgi:lambda family phage tail tape measure protein
MLKEIDAASPEKTVTAINNVLLYLEKAGPEAKNFKQSFEKTVEPLLKINEELIKSKTNIRESAERASNLAAELMNIQTPQLAGISAARRNFDQVSAIRKEGALKLQEFEFQLNEKTAQDGANREKELAAFKLKNQQEVNDKIADFVKGQSEAYRSAIFQIDTKRDQLKLQEKLNSLSEEGRLSSFNVYQLEQDILQNAYNYQEALRGIAEQRRKNVISADQQAKLEKDAADIRDKSDQQAYASAERRQRTLLETQNQLLDQDKRKLALFNQTSILSDREKKNAEAIFQVNEERQKQLIGLQQLNDPILRIAKEKEINDIYDERVNSIKRQQDAELELQHNFTAGWQVAYANYREESENSFKRAQDLFKTVTKNMEDMFVTFFKTGKLGWKDFLQSVIDALMRSQIQQLIAKTFGGIGGGAKTGGLFGGSIIPGFLAGGGPADANSPYIVGENGPELFVPSTAGTVVPNNQIGASSVVYNINAVDAMSFKQMIAADPSFLYAVSEQGRRRIPGAR